MNRSKTTAKIKRDCGNIGNNMQFTCFFIASDTFNIPSSIDSVLGQHMVLVSVQRSLFRALLYDFSDDKSFVVQLFI